MITLYTSFQTKEFSSQIPDVELYITQQRILATVKVTKSGDTTQIYEEQLYPDLSGKICLSDLDVLIEPYANRWLLFELQVDIKEQQVGTDSIGGEVITITDTRTLITTVVSCRANILNMTAEQWCNKRFLTLMDGARTTAHGWQERLTFIGNDTATCTAYYSDGSSQQRNVPVVNALGDAVIIDSSPQNFTTSGKILMRYVIRAGERTQEYQVNQHPEPDIAPVLLFWNSFGVQEIAYCTGGFHQVSSFDRKQARIGRTKETYDMDEKESFKADTGVLTFPMANWWREVLRSKDIKMLTVYDGYVETGYGKPVIITSEKSDLSNEADHLPRITFEFEYADRNHNIFDVRAEGRIFDDTFDNTFN